MTVIRKYHAFETNEKKTLVPVAMSKQSHTHTMQNYVVQKNPEFSHSSNADQGFKKKVSFEFLAVKEIKSE